MFGRLFRTARRVSPPAPSSSARAIDLALEHHRAGRLAEAESAYREALAADPDDIDALHFLGVIAYQSGSYEAAAESISRALSLNASNPAAQSNLGNVRSAQGRFDEAVACYRKAVALAPGFVDAYVNLGNALKVLGDSEGAEESYRRALALKPDSALTLFNYALLKLLSGDYESGLPLFESRLVEGALPQQHSRLLQARLAQVGSAPRWRGEALAGKTLLAWSDQGLGDSLMAARYLPLLKARGARRLAVLCEPELVRLIGTVEGVDEVISTAAAEPLASIDWQCPMMSLPLLFGTRVETIPRDVPYLSVPEENRRTWTARLAQMRRPGIGLVWAGGKVFSRDALRSVRLGQFAPLLESVEGTFVSLQKGEEACQIADAGLKIFDAMDECRDLLDTAALIEQLDLVISVDTSVAHLAGALGKRVWLLNRFESEWRWMQQREDSPWYPSMRIFRQRRSGDWGEVLQRVAAALRP
jgi:Tfp pilus assembly protein PilF